MSCLSHLPYGKILDYWYEKLDQYKYRFILTKTLEIFAFRSNKFRGRKVESFRCLPNLKPHSIPKNPKVSLVIAAFIRNQIDLENLKNLNLSIQQQTKQPDHIIIIDDCSPLSYPFPETVILQKMDRNSGPAAARNKGIQTALELGSDIIVFTDVDCILDKNWIQVIIDGFHQNPNFHILAGSTFSFDRNWWGIYHEINGTLNGRKFINSDRLMYGVTANLAISASVAQQVLFDENFKEAACEDVDFCFRANEKGFGIKHASEMVIQHNYGYDSNSLGNLMKFVKLFKKYGKAQKLLMQNIPDLYSFFDNTEEISIFSQNFESKTTS